MLRSSWAELTNSMIVLFCFGFFFKKKFFLMESEHKLGGEEAREDLGRTRGGENMIKISYENLF